MSSCFETFAKASAEYLHSRSIDTERAEAIRAAILKQWKERDEPKAQHLAQTTGIGRYKMVFEYAPDMEKDEFAQFLPEELKNVPPTKGSTFIYWSPHAPSKYEVHLNFETPRNLRLRELKQQAQQEKKEPVEEVFRALDTSITYTRCPKGYHFIDDEGHIARNQKRSRVNGDGDDKSPPEKTKKQETVKAPEDGAAVNGVGKRIERLRAVMEVDTKDIMFEAWEALKEQLHEYDIAEDLDIMWQRMLLNSDRPELAQTYFDNAIARAEAEYQMVDE